MRSRLIALLALVGLLSATPSFAGHHLWRFSELYSDRIGSVQFVELFCTASSEQGLGSFTVTTGTNTFNFVTNLPSTATANTWVLLATSNFASKPGAVTPDYIIPSNFFATGGGTINYASGIDIWNYGAVPTDGIHSLLKNGSTAVNSPTNFAGQAGSIDLSTSVPSTQTWGLLALIGALLFMASGLVRKRAASLA